MASSAPASATATARATATAEAPTSATTPGGTPTRHPSAAWPEFDQNAQRTGIAPGLPTAGRLTRSWTATLDGAVYGQPLVVGGDVIAATENDSVYAISRATGKTVWRAHVGTPVPQSALHGCGDNAWDQQRPALTIDHGRVYAALRRARGRLRRLHRRRGRCRPRRQGRAAELARPRPAGRAPSGEPAARWSSRTVACGSPTGTARPAPGNPYDGSDWYQPQPGLAP